MTPFIPFVWAWIAFDLGDATYCQFPYKELQPIRALDGTLSWLGQASWQESPDGALDQRASQERYTTKAQATVRDLAAQAERLGLTPPPAFAHLCSPLLT